jgi:transcriptional regulator, propionate catabolism operon regulatory protein
MAMRIAVMSYGGLSVLFRDIICSLPPGINIRLIDALLEDAVEIAKALEKNDEADVFISAGANYSLLSQHVQAPLVEIKVTGFDILLALEKARQTSGSVALVTYGQKITRLDKVLNTLSIPVRQAVFRTVSEADTVLDVLRDDGITTVIGASLICTKAREKGLTSFFIYSEDGVARALDSAIKIALTKKKEMAKALELQAVISFASEGIIASDADGRITVFNPAAEKITRISRENALGKYAHHVLRGTRLNHVMRTRQSEINQIQSIGEIKILTNRIPIVVQEEVVGAVATFRDVGMIQEAEEKIRQKLHAKGFVAKNNFGNIIGQSQIMRATKDEAARYANSESTILILGESGTGKELFAQSIHNASRRAKRQFVAVNCAAFPPNLLESELFGYEEGAFTGARKGGKQGLFELAHNGTIFLDEVGEMPLPIQSRFLRVLEEHEVIRIGGERILPVNIRAIASTNKHLWKLVQDHELREDLYYRLSILEICLPSLRQRKQDIPQLIEKFLGEFRPDLSASTVDRIAGDPMFMDYRWPGNVRELRNVVERLAVLYDGADTIEKLITKLLGEKVSRHIVGGQEEKYAELLAAAGGNKSAVARTMGISRTTLWRKLRRFNELTPKN